ncbi:MAG: enoyl-CoA hydratase-related protein [Bryobacteraceae bacterium]
MELVLYKIESRIARIALNRPEKRNALTPELLEQLQDALDRAAKDPDVTVVLIRGEGKDFCAGFDLKEFNRRGSKDVMNNLDDARALADILLTIRRHPRPVIAAIHGRALGGGGGIAAASDLTLATDTAKIGYPEVNIGYIPAMVASLVTRAISDKRMFEMFATGDPIAAPDAAAIGLINRVFPEAGFDAAVEEYVAKIAQKSASALSLTKRLLYQIDGQSLEKAVETGMYFNVIGRMTEDAQKGFEKFTKKE